MPTSYFLFLNNKKLTLPADHDLYQRLTRNTYKQEAFQFGYMLLLCKLYDMANLPAPATKALFYGGVIGVVCTYSFYRASQNHVNVLNQLDNKYESHYKRYLKEEKEAAEIRIQEQTRQKQMQAENEELLAKLQTNKDKDE